MPGKKTEVIVDVPPDTDESEYSKVSLPKELIPFVECDDKFFSSTKQLAMAQKRWNAANPDVPYRPTIITSAFDLLILQEKRRDDPGLSPSFTVCGRTAESGSPQYDFKLKDALDFIESCMCLEDREGKPRPKYGQAECFVSIGMPIPEGFEEWKHLEKLDFTPSYFEDSGKYVALWQPRHRVLETE